MDDAVHQVDDIQDASKGVGEGSIKESMDAVYDDGVHGGGLQKPSVKAPSNIPIHILHSELLKFLH